jgi:hypothetical protein
VSKFIVPVLDSNPDPEKLIAWLVDVGKVDLVVKASSEEAAIPKNFETCIHRLVHDRTSTFGVKTKVANYL